MKSIISGRKLAALWTIICQIQALLLKASDYFAGTQQEGEDPLPLHSGQVLNDLVEAKAPGKRKAVPGRLRKKFSKQKKLD